jgi:type II secretory pathway component PulJ
MGNRDDRIRQAELTLEAMERDGMAACERTPAERPKAWDKTATLTDEQKAEPFFVSIARIIWRSGKGHLIPWLWDRYRDGQMMGEAYQAVMRQVARAEPHEDPRDTSEKAPATDWLTEHERKKDGE